MVVRGSLVHLHTAFELHTLCAYVIQSKGIYLLSVISCADFSRYLTWLALVAALRLHRWTQKLWAGNSCKPCEICCTPTKLALLQAQPYQQTLRCSFVVGGLGLHTGHYSALCSRAVVQFATLTARLL